MVQRELGHRRVDDELGWCVQPRIHLRVILTDLMYVTRTVLELGREHAALSLTEVRFQVDCIRAELAEAMRVRLETRTVEM